MFFKLSSVALLIALLMCNGCKKHIKESNAPLEIEITPVLEMTMANTKHFIGPLSSNYYATVQPRISGFLATSSFANGMPVKKGDLIFTIDDSHQRANLLAAEAALSSAKAKAVEARRNYERAIPLARINAISQTQLDQYTAENTAAIASVKSAEQTLQNAILEESYTRIYAPISGIISSSAATAGDYIGPDTQFSTLTTIQSVDTVSFDLALPMREYLEASGRTSFSYDNATLLSDIRLEVADGGLYPEEGFYKFTRQSVASELGTIVLVVGFRNPNYALKAGEFARVTAAVGANKKGIVVSQQAVRQIQNIASVWVIQPDSTAEYREVKLGNTYNEGWVIEQGLNAGEMVALTGLQKLRKGAKVIPIIK